MSKQVSQTRAALMGLLFALVGFSYAIATSTGNAPVANDASSRIVGSAPLRFTNAFFGGVRDLGQAAAGSSVTRYARATGGVRPYRFASSGTPSLASATASSNAALTLELNGRLSGSLGNLPAGALQFNITVTDSKGTQPNTVTELFQLRIDNSGQFKFSTATLSEGVQFQPYFDKLEVLNGNSPITFSVSNVALNGTAQASLEAVGLSLSSVDGSIFGKPIVSGTLTFTARAVDARGNAALDSTGTTANQTVTVTLTAGQTITSDVVIESIKAKVGATGKDSVAVKATVNTNGRRISDLTGDTVEVRVGSFTTSSFSTTRTPATLDAKGKIVKPAKGVAAKTDPTFKGGINSKGQLNVTAAKLTLTGLLFVSVPGATINLAVGLRVGDAITSSSFLRFDVKTSSKQTQVTYKKTGANDIGGDFLVTDVKGKDNTKTTAEDDSWKVTFQMLVPPSVSVTGVNAANVAIGNNFVDNISLTAKTSSSGTSLSGKQDKADNTVTSIKIDLGKGKSQLTTTSITAALTNIREAARAAATGNFFALGITLLSGSGVVVNQGEGSIAIFPSKTQWKSTQK